APRTGAIAPPAPSRPPALNPAPGRGIVARLAPPAASHALTRKVLGGRVGVTRRLPQPQSQLTTAAPRPPQCAWHSPCTTALPGWLRADSLCRSRSYFGGREGD